MLLLLSCLLLRTNEKKECLRTKKKYKQTKTNQREGKKGIEKREKKNEREKNSQYIFFIFSYFFLCRLHRLYFFLNPTFQKRKK